MEIWWLSWRQQLCSLEDGVSNCFTGLILGTSQKSSSFDSNSCFCLSHTSKIINPIDPVGDLCLQPVTWQYFREQTENWHIRTGRNQTCLIYTHPWIAMYQTVFWNTQLEIAALRLRFFFFIQQLNIQAQRKFYLLTESCNPITVRRIFSLEVESMLHALKQNEWVHFKD